MTSDLIFSVLPREGKVPMSHDEQKVQEVSKEAKLRRLNDEEKELNAEEREAREKYRAKKDNKNQHAPERDSESGENSSNSTEPVVDEHGRKHVDFYI